MDIFKMTVDHTTHEPLTREHYINTTGKNPPYFTIGQDGKMRHYAVCPSCDNPIQIIGLVIQKVERPLYARHVPHSVLGLAIYRQSAYDNCPLAVKNNTQVDKNTKKVGHDDISPKILAILREHFDRIILVLQNAIGIIISKKLAESLLNDYLAEEGHSYKYASLLNIPWIFGYMCRSKNLLGRFIKDEDMKKAILANESRVAFSGDQLIKLTKQEKNIPQINIYFSNHTMQPRENTIEESMQLIVFIPGREQPKVIYKKRIVFDYNAFQYYLNIPEGKGFRKQELLDMVKQKL